MEQTVRIKAITHILKETDHITVKALAARLHYSEMTIRRDLKAMEADGFIRVDRGIVRYVEEEHRVPVEERQSISLDEKEMLMKQALPFLSDHMTVFIDDSTTCLHVIPYLTAFEGIRILTNSVHCLLHAEEYHIPVILSGGTYKESERSMTGSLAQTFLSQFQMDVALLSSSAISEDGVISNREEDENAIRRVVMEHADKTVFFFTSPKIGKRCLYTLCHTEDASAVFFRTEAGK